MCTVSWVPEAGGYTLCFNRDERRTRAPARSPTIGVAQGTRYIAPEDGESGGTWLAVNEFGLTLGLLNRYEVPDYVPPREPVSRGHIIPDIISHATAPEACEALARRAIGGYQPFSLVALDPGSAVHLLLWDGNQLVSATHRAPGLVLTSSASAEPEVRAAREAEFGALVPVTPDTLIALHRSHRPERGARSICMHRTDAETRSFTAVRVSRFGIAMRHVPDAPCRGEELTPVTLAARQPQPHSLSR